MEINVCGCGNPLISTFAFSGSEFYCVECGNQYAFWGGYESVKLTKKLEKIHDENKNWFSHILDGYIGGGMKLRDCKQCDEGGYHLHHATPTEIEAHEKSMKMLSDRVNKSI